MSNVMSMANLKNKVSRNGFDLSERTAFTAKVGQLLPVMVKDCIPGDKFKINVKAFARTQPVNTAAFTRIRQYYDFFFVPYSQLWRSFPTFITQMDSNPMLASSVTESRSVPKYAPYVTTVDLANIVMYLSSLNSSSASSFTDVLSFNSGKLTNKLLSYLGYGDYSSYFGKKFSDITALTSTNLRSISLNVLPLAAYQKIYFDFFRNNQWEANKPWCYNFDYVDTDSSAHIALASHLSDGKLQDSLVTLRYCNWNKDLFMGLQPRAQYSMNPAYVTGAPIGGQAGAPQQFSILSLRQAEALQKWSEISLSGNYDYKTQVEKHFNVSMPQCMSNMVYYLGGSSDNLDISEVVNQTLTGDNSADIAGKGVGVTDGYIDYDVKEHGIIMCIYHAVPLLDYSMNGLFKHNTRSLPTDYAIPEFDSIGMQAVNRSELVYNSSVAPRSDSLDISTIGYAPRYYDYKTSYDRILGSFQTTESSWVSPISESYLKANLGSVNYTYRFLKCSPRVLNSIFGVAADDNESTDQLLINCAFDIKAVRNLDYDGLPY